jgi:hypothetical protein
MLVKLAYPGSLGNSKQYIPVDGFFIIGRPSSTNPKNHFQKIVKDYCC